MLGPMRMGAGPGMFDGLRVIEIADESAEYCGLLLAGLGAEVIKVEPPGGSPTRRIGPFLDGQPGPDRSLFFWHYNRGKRSIVLDRDTPEGRAGLMALLDGADVLLDSSCGALNEELGLDRAALLSRFPALVIARMTPFGDDGPWRGWKGSDLVHLALGGVAMNCGYDPDPRRHYDTPPIAPQVWQAYHIAGDQLAVGIAAALLHRLRTGQGQDVSCAVHEAVAKSTEMDLMSWVMRRAPLWRLTCRHAVETPTHTPNIGHTKDGRWFVSWGVSARDQSKLVPFLQRWDMAADLAAPAQDADVHARAVPGSAPASESSAHVQEVVARFIRAFCYGDMPWREAQEAGLLWAPLRKPHESALDEHWRARGSYAEVEHPEHGRAFTYAVSKWLSTETTWSTGRRAPLLGEDTAAIRARAATPPEPSRRTEAGPPGAVGARQAVRAAGRADPRFLMVPRLGGRHQVPRRPRRGKPQGGVEGQSGHTLWRRWRPWAAVPRGRRRPPRCRASPTRTWAASSTTRTAASAACRSTSATHADCRSRATWCASATSWRRVSRPASSTA